MKDQPRIPTVGEYVRQVGTLIEIQEIVPDPAPPPPVDYIFEETYARIKLMLGGETIKDIEELNEFYGKGTATREALKEAKEYCASRSITSKSELEVVVIEVITQYRARPTNIENFYDKRFVDFARLPFGTHRDLPDPIEKVVWSSKSIQ